MGCGAYGASFVGPGFGTPRRTREAGSAVLGVADAGCVVSCATAEIALSNETSSAVNAVSITFLFTMVTVRIVIKGGVRSSVSNHKSMACQVITTEAPD